MFDSPKVILCSVSIVLEICKSKNRSNPQILIEEKGVPVLRHRDTGGEKTREEDAFPATHAGLPLPRGVARSIMLMCFRTVGVCRRPLGPRGHR